MIAKLPKAQTARQKVNKIRCSENQPFESRNAYALP